MSQFSQVLLDIPTLENTMSIFISSLEKHKQDLDDDMLYGIAAEEIASDSISRGLYAKALSETAGDESKARARYIKLRVAMEIFT